MKKSKSPQRKTRSSGKQTTCRDSEIPRYSSNIQLRGKSKGVAPGDPEPRKEKQMFLGSDDESSFHSSYDEEVIHSSEEDPDEEQKEAPSKS